MSPGLPRGPFKKYQHRSLGTRVENMEGEREGSGACRTSSSVLGGPGRQLVRLPVGTREASAPPEPPPITPSARTSFRGLSGRVSVLTFSPSWPGGPGSPISPCGQKMEGYSRVTAAPSGPSCGGSPQEHGHALSPFQGEVPNPERVLGPPFLWAQSLSTLAPKSLCSPKSHAATERGPWTLPPWLQGRGTCLFGPFKPSPSVLAAPQGSPLIFTPTHAPSLAQRER